MAIRAANPFMFQIAKIGDAWHVFIAYDDDGDLASSISICDTEREAQDVQAALVVAAAGRG